MNVMPHNMRNHHANKAGKEKAQKKEIIGLPKGGYKKYAHCDIYRPPRYLAPPISGNIFKHKISKSKHPNLYEQGGFY